MAEGGAKVVKEPPSGGREEAGAGRFWGGGWVAGSRLTSDSDGASVTSIGVQGRLIPQQLGESVQ